MDITLNMADTISWAGLLDLIKKKNGGRQKIASIHFLSTGCEWNVTRSLRLLCQTLYIMMEYIFKLWGKANLVFLS